MTRTHDYAGDNSGSRLVNVNLQNSSQGMLGLQISSASKHDYSQKHLNSSDKLETYGMNASQKYPGNFPTTLTADGHKKKSVYSILGRYPVSTEREKITG